MQTLVTANELRGRAIGALFFAFFGAVWIGLALYAREILTGINVTWMALDFSVLAGMAVWVIRKSRRFPKVPEDPAIGRAFGRINGIQWAAVAVVVFSFHRMHLDAYIMNGITAVVALHFFPIGRMFRYRMHYVTGAVLLVWAGTCAAIVPLEQMQGTTALGTGIGLWASAFLALLLALGRARRPILANTSQENGRVPAAN